MSDELSVKPAISQKILSDHELTEDAKESHRCVISIQCRRHSFHLLSSS